MANSQEVLKQLFTNENDINTDELFKLLSPYIKINQESKNIIFLDSTSKHPLKNKLILFLLAKKAIFLLKELKTDRVRNTDIIKETGIPKGSVNPTLKLLKDNSLISSDKEGYYITSYQISKIKTIFNSNEKNN